MIPPPLTPAEIRREVRRQLRKRGCKGYRAWDYKHSAYDGPVCSEPDCEGAVRQEGWRCHVCSAKATERLAAERAARMRTNKRKAAT